MAPRPTHRSARNQSRSDTRSETGQDAQADVHGNADRDERHGASSSDRIAADLSYTEARTALDLALAQLQATDLDVEEMAGLFLRARGYAHRCEALLADVEQQVLVWDSTDPGSEPAPYGADPS